MKIYVGHSTGFDYKKELYEVLRNSALNSEHEIVLPHEQDEGIFNSKEFLKTCDIMIAEVSHPSTGLGIELGWANSYGVPIIYIFKNGAKISKSLNSVTNTFFEYSNTKELVIEMEKKINRLPI